MYSANDIAKWFIEKGIQHGKPFTPIQVNKLAYIAQGIHVATYGKPLFFNSCEAWKYGPVVKEIYHSLCSLGHRPIVILECVSEARGIDPSDTETLQLLESVFNIFGSKNGLELSAWTHRQGSAWDISYNKNGGSEFLGYEISLDLLKQEFKSMIKKSLKRNRATGWRENNQ